ncbi:hypothetical protein MRX96_015745 [Rhipicephalus microplus]
MFDFRKLVCLAHEHRGDSLSRHSPQFQAVLFLGKQEFSWCRLSLFHKSRNSNETTGEDPMASLALMFLPILRVHCAACGTVESLASAEEAVASPFASVEER